MRFLFLLIFLSTIAPCIYSQDWQWQNPLPGGNSFEDLFFLDASSGWMVGYDGAMFRTTDGGLSWISQESGTTKNLYSIHSSDGVHLWAVGAEGVIIHSTDGGLNWTEEESNSEISLWSVYSSGPTKCWAVGDGGVFLHTFDGGETWFSQPGGINAQAIFFVDGLNGWACWG